VTTSSAGSVIADAAVGAQPLEQGAVRPESVGQRGRRERARSTGQPGVEREAPGEAGLLGDHREAALAHQDLDHLVAELEVRRYVVGRFADGHDAGARHEREQGGQVHKVIQ
jgi:hypothetical protein